MATFYLLPSRLSLGQRFGEFLSALFPGLSWKRDSWSDLAETLASMTDHQRGVYVLFREDLPDEHDLETCLTRDFGAEPCDVIIEIHAAGSIIRRWMMAGARSAA